MCLGRVGSDSLWKRGTAGRARRRCAVLARRCACPAGLCRAIPRSGRGGPPIVLVPSRRRGIREGGRGHPVAPGLRVRLCGRSRSQRHRRVRRPRHVEPGSPGIGLLPHATGPTVAAIPERRTGGTPVDRRRGGRDRFPRLSIGCRPGPGGHLREAAPRAGGTRGGEPGDRARIVRSRGCPFPTSWCSPRRSRIGPICCWVGPSWHRFLPAPSSSTWHAAGLVDHGALREALTAGRLGGAWLDVLPEEPLPPDSGLWDAPGLSISTHNAVAMGSYPVNLARQCATPSRSGSMAGRSPIPCSTCPRSLPA